MLLAALCAAALLARGRDAAAELVDLPPPDIREAIVLEADAARKWRQDDADVWLLEGNCRIRQGATVATSGAAVVWVERDRYGDLTNRLTVYLEDDVRIEQRGENGTPRALSDNSWYGKLESTHSPRFPSAVGGEPENKPVAYVNGMMRRHAYRDGVIRRTQFTQPGQGGAAVESAEELPAPGQRRLRAWPRSRGVGVQGEWFQDENTGEWVALIDSGVNLVIDGLEGFGSIDVSTDRMVIWTSGLDEPDLTGQSTQRAEQPLELYMEGNIVFRQGERVIYAQRMYYDVTHEIGAILDAELLTPVRDYDGLMRLKADLVQQTGPDQFLARGAFVTSSRMGRPGYRLAADTIYVEDRQFPAFNPFEGPAPAEPLVEHDMYATSYSNTLFVEEVPVFYWPVLATRLKRPEFYIRKLRLKNDNIYGNQVLTTWDPYQLLGIDNPPAGTDWDVSLDYMSERGIGHGTNFSYARDDPIFGIPGSYAGLVDFWGIQDHDLDNLGAGRSAIPLEKDYRYRLLGRHRWFLPDNMQLTGELGWISDRNFLEQYFEYEWDRFKDLNTGVELKQLLTDSTWSVNAQTRLNSFFTQTEWLPRGDHFILGRSLLGDRLSWFSHTQAGFANLRVLSTPEDPLQQATFARLPWEVPSQGERLVTRQEIDLPVRAGPFKFVFSALGELAHWGQDLTGNDTQRAYGRLGAKASLPMWAVDSEVESNLFNVHGLAHKVVFEVDAGYADASRDIAEFPLYDPLNDDNIEAFQRRFQFTTFGAPPIPPQFDERFYALRTGLGEDVTASSVEVVDDLETVRMGVRQRWQTQRGLPGQRRITDWIVLDTDITWFPDPSRDNFGENFGLLGYDFRWHVGDRTTVVSRGLYDFFASGQQLTRVGLHISRPPRGNLALTFHSLEGPFSSQVLGFSYSYRMTHKWISSFSTAYDLGEHRNIGQQLSITRIGESFLVSFGFNLDVGKDNFGVNLNIEPRFLPRTRLGRVGGAQVPIAGIEGIE